MKDEVIPEKLCQAYWAGLRVDLGVGEALRFCFFAEETTVWFASGDGLHFIDGVG
jgi:TRAP-type mannitol/chloroaromatic compound transport system substrate-binding protein